MAVYVVPRRAGFWGNVTANLGNGLFDHLMGGMLTRDAQARQARRNNEFWTDVSRTMTPQPGLPQPEAPRAEYSEDVQNLANSATRGMPAAADNQGWEGLWDSTAGLGKEYRPGREELMGVFGRHGVMPQEAELAMNFYKNQFETADKLGYQDDVASRVGNLDFNVRENPERAMRSGVTAQAYGLSPQGLYAYAYPNMTSGVMDNGDRNTLRIFDPATGDSATQDLAKGVDPTKAREAASREHVAQINQSPRYGVVYGANGEVMVVNDRTGAVTETGKVSYPRGAGGYSGADANGQGAKPLTISDKKNISELVAQGIQLATFRDGSFDQQAFDAWMYNAFGNNPEALSYAQSTVNFPQFMSKEMGLTLAKTNPYQPTQPVTPQGDGQGWQVYPPQGNASASPITLTVAQLEEYARDAGISVEQARAQVEREGGVIR